MVTQSIASCSVFEAQSFVKGYHDYMHLWTPRAGEVLTLQREPQNTMDQHAVAVIKNNLVVGNVPYTLAPLFSQLLRRSCNKGKAEVTGDKVNRGDSYGLEIPCKYRLYGPEFYIERVKTLAQVDQKLTSSIECPL